MHRYDWIALLDVDEVIVPRKHNNWAEMMEEVGPQITPTGLSISVFNFLSTEADFSISIFNISRWLRRQKTSPDGLSGTSISWTT